jgi:hypothetical protein
MSDNLPPLPHPHCGLLYIDREQIVSGFTEDQMRSYAAAAVERLRSELEAAQAEARRMRASLNIIAERTSSEDPCRALVECARRALRDAAMQAGAAP